MVRGGGSGTEHATVELERARGRDLPVEGAAALEAEPALALPALGIVEDLLDAVRDRSRVERVHEGGGVARDLLEGGAPRADDGQARGHGLHHGQAEALF